MYPTSCGSEVTSHKYVSYRASVRYLRLAGTYRQCRWPDEKLKTIIESESRKDYSYSYVYRKKAFRFSVTIFRGIPLPASPVPPYQVRCKARATARTTTLCVFCCCSPLLCFSWRILGCHGSSGGRRRSHCFRSFSLSCGPASPLLLSPPLQRTQSFVL